MHTEWLNDWLTNLANWIQWTTLNQTKSKQLAQQNGLTWEVDISSASLKIPLVRNTNSLLSVSYLPRHPILRHHVCCCLDLRDTDLQLHKTTRHKCCSVQVYLYIHVLKQTAFKNVIYFTQNKVKNVSLIFQNITCQNPLKSSCHMISEEVTSSMWRCSTKKYYQPTYAASVRQWPSQYWKLGHLEKLAVQSGLNH